MNVSVPFPEQQSHTETSSTAVFYFFPSDVFQSALLDVDGSYRSKKPIPALHPVLFMSQVPPQTISVPVLWPGSQDCCPKGYLLCS